MPLPTEKLAAQPAKTTTTTTQQRRHTTGTNPPRSVARRGVPPPTGGTARWARWARRATARRAPSGPKLRGQWAGGKNCPGSAGRGRGGMRRRIGKGEDRGPGRAAKALRARSIFDLGARGLIALERRSSSRTQTRPRYSGHRIRSVDWASRPRYVGLRGLDINYATLSEPRPDSEFG